MSKFKNIHVIDMGKEDRIEKPSRKTADSMLTCSGPDTIDISNLNRQFLFRKSDVGKFKAEVAAKFVERRVKGVSITPHNCRIQDFGEDFYKQFQLVVCGLDSIEARRWINAMLVGLVESDPQSPDAIKPLIDGGTEGMADKPRRLEQGRADSLQVSRARLEWLYPR